jgi:hypothetical protein
MGTEALAGNMDVREGQYLRGMIDYGGAINVA